MAIGKKELVLVFKAATEKAQKGIKGVGASLDAVGKSGKVAQGGLNKMGKGFKFIGGAIKAAGIGLLIGVLSQLTGMFSSNQKTADTFGRIMLKLQPVFKVLGDIIGKVAEALEFVIDLFVDAIDWIGGLFGATNDVADATAGYAEDIVRLRSEVKLMNAELALTQLEYQKEAELQRQIRDDTSRTVDERISANNKLASILERQSKEEQEMALVALELAEKELALDEQNIDLQVAVIEAKTKLAEIDERITSQRSEQLTNLTSLEQESADLEKTANEERQGRLKELLALQNQDLKAKEETRDSLKEQLKVAKDVHKQTMEMLKAEAMAKEIEARKEEMRRLLKIQEQVEAARIQLKWLKKTTQNSKEYREFEKEFEEWVAKEKVQAAELKNNKLLKIEEQFGILMNDATESWLITEEGLITQAADTLDKHFETAKEKEIREEKEKYKKLLGLAENDAKRTKQLKQEKIDALKAIDDKYIKKQEEVEQKVIDTRKKIFDEFQASMLKIAEAGTEKAQAAWEFMMDFEEKRKEKAKENARKQEELEHQRKEKTINNALATMNALVSIASTQSKKEIAELDKKLKKGLITQEQYDKKLSDIEVKQAKKEKAAALIQIGVDTARGISGAVSAGAGLVFPANLAAISTGILAVLAGVAQASSVLGQSVDTGSTDMPDDTIEDMGDVVGGVPGITFGAAGSDVPPVQAYVVETDISNAQALQSELDLQSTL